MKTTSLILIFILNCFSLWAQEYKYIPFPDSNAVWSEVYWKPISDPAPRWVYNQYALFNEDTIINGITYHKLFHSNSSERISRKNSVCIGGIREDSIKRIIVNSSMFQLVPEIKEVILFDFSLNIGDTINEYINDTISANVRFKLVVKNIDTISINHTTRKVLGFDIPWTHWIEGIGSVQGLIFTSGDLPTNGMSNDLVCMHQNDTLLFYNSGSGDVYYDGCVPSFVIDDVALLPNTDIKVYPNPVTNGIVHFENLNFDTLELFDSSGNQLDTKNIKGNSCYELDVLNLPSGIYYYRLKTKGLVPTKGKLIIH